MSYYLADDTISVFVRSPPNSGLTSGQYLRRGRHKNLNTGHPFTPDDLYQGARLIFRSLTLEIDAVDDYSKNYTHMTTEEILGLVRQKPTSAQLGHERRQIGQSEEEIHFGDLLRKLVSVALDQTTDRDHRAQVSVLLQGAGFQDRLDGLFLGGLDEAARVHDHDLGVIDLMLEVDGGQWKVAGFETSTRPISKRNEDRSITALVESQPEVLAAVQQEHDETLAYVRRAVGKTAAPLHSYFALVADDPSVQIVSIAQKWYIEQMMQGTEHEGLPILSAAAPFKAGGRGGPEYYTDVPAGDVAIKNVADLYLYPNTARAVRVTGADVRNWLERSAGMFNQITPGEADQVLLNPEFPSYNFDVIDGVTYQIDLSQPSKFTPKGEPLNPDAHRITNLKFNGEPVADDMEFIIATNNYRASGGGSFPGAMGDTIIFEAPDTNRDVIVRYIVEEGTIEPSADANWSFAPMPGTSVLFDTGPKAADYADEVPGVTIAPAGEGPDGFARFRIEL